MTSSTLNKVLKIKIKFICLNEIGMSCLNESGMSCLNENGMSYQTPHIFIYIYIHI